MPNSSGNFCWYELTTTDAKGAEAFYRDILGCSMQDAGMPDFAYTILTAADAPVGGLMEMPAEACSAGARPGWFGYIAVDDVDAIAKRVAEAGGAIHKSPTDIPNVGRFAVAADPHGAIFVLFKGQGEPLKVAPLGTPGHVGWRELHAGDLDSTFAFYSTLFGWTKAQAVDMGPMGIYQVFARDGVQTGGMMKKADAEPAPFWLYYFNVSDIDAAAAKVRAKAGDILNGPHQVPGGDWIVQCRDPQGVMFALVGPKH
jgi:predicted enzyme related to lactoylglutathione lyase